MSRLISRRWMAVPLLAAIVAAGGVAEAGMKEDIAALKQELATVKGELEKIKGLLRSKVRRNAPPPAKATVATRGRPVLGRKDAPVTIVEFSDYECPFCMRFASTTLVKLKKTYIETGKVRLVFRDFPLTNIHPRAAKAAEAAHCAGDQGKYWAMHDRLFRNRRALAPPALKRHAKALGLEADRFAKCLAGGSYAAQVKADLEAGARAGVRGTPTFFIGATGTNGRITGVRVAGAQPMAVFRRIIEAELAKLAGKE